VEQEKNQPEKKPAAMFEWDRKIVHPYREDEVAMLVSAAMRVGFNYAKERYVAKDVAFDLVDW